MTNLILYRNLVLIALLFPALTEGQPIKYNDIAHYENIYGCYDMAMDGFGNYTLYGIILNDTLTIGDDTTVYYGNGRYFLTKFYNNGDFRWIQQIKSGGITRSSIYADEIGNVYLWGEFSDTLIIYNDTSISIGNGDGIIIKFDQNGNYISKYQLNSWWIDCNSISKDKEGNIIASGSFKSTVEIKDTILHTQVQDGIILKLDTDLNYKSFIHLHNYYSQININDISFNNQNDYIIGGSTLCQEITIGDTTIVGEGGIMVLTLDSNGNYKSLWNVDDTMGDRFNKIMTDSQNNIYCAGCIVEPWAIFNFFVAKYTPNGELIWVDYASSTNPYVSDMHLDSNDNLYIAGAYFNSMEVQDTIVHASGGRGLYLIKYNQDGNFGWITSADGPQDDRSAGMSIFQDDITISGTIYGSITFGDTTINIGNSKGIYIAKISGFSCNIGEDVTICQGDTIIIGSEAVAYNGVAPYSYQWTPQMWLSNPNSPLTSASPEESTIYYLTVTDNFGDLALDSLEVIVLPKPMVSLGQDTTISIMDTLVLTTNSNFISHEWQDGSNENYFMVNGLELGEGNFSFFVNITDINGCFGSDTINISIIDNSGIHQNQKELIQLFPNPTTGKLRIALKDKINPELKIQIFNTFGLVLNEFKFYDSQNKDVNLEIDISNNPSGIYYLKCSSEKNQQIVKVIKY